MTKEVLGWNSQSQPNCFLIDGQIIRKPVDIANLLQKYFEEKIKNIIKNLNNKNTGTPWIIYREPWTDEKK